MKIIGQVEVAVTDTPRRVSLRDEFMPNTLVNLGANTAYYRYNPDKPAGLTTTLDEASEAAIRALGGVPLRAGHAVVIPGDVPYVDIACITGETATVDVIPGALVDSTSITATIGAVTANAGTNLNTSLLALETGGNLASLVTLLGVGTGAMASAQAVTIATDDTVIGATDDTEAAAGGVGSISSKLRKISTDIGHIDQDTSKLQTAAGGGYVRQDATSTIAKETGGNLAALLTVMTNFNAFTKNGKSTDDLETISIAQGVTPGAATIKADDSGKHVLVMGVFGTMDTADGTLQFREADDSPVYSGAIPMADNGGPALPVTGFPLFTSADGKGCEIFTSGGAFNGAIQVLVVDD